MKLQGCNPLPRPYFLGWKGDIAGDIFSLHDKSVGWVESGRWAEKGPLKIDALEDDISFELWGIFGDHVSFRGCSWWFEAYDYDFPRCDLLGSVGQVDMHEVEEDCLVLGGSTS